MQVTTVSAGKPTPTKSILFNQCKLDLSVKFANSRHNKPMWCIDGSAQDQLRMIQALTKRKGAMPYPRELVLPSLVYNTPQEAFKKFMLSMGTDEDTLRMTLPSKDKVVVSRDLFLDTNKDWKISKRQRDQWLLYLAEVIKSPQEIWKLNLEKSEELYLMGRFLRGKQRIDAITVFKRDGDAGEWKEGKTSYTFDKPDGIERKRKSIESDGAWIRWIEN